MHFENEVEQHTKSLIASYPRLLADKDQQASIASIDRKRQENAQLSAVLS